MIIGIGTDIVEIARIKRALQNDGFSQRVFTEKELAFADKKARNLEIFAGTFAAKEAVAKAFGTGIRGFNFKDIEILRNELGKPEVYLHNNAKLVFEQLACKNIFLSISHTDSNCVSFCVIEG